MKGISLWTGSGKPSAGLGSLATIAACILGCDLPEAPPVSPKRFTVEQTDNEFSHFKVIHDSVTGCQFLYISAYKEAGLAPIPGTCRHEQPDTTARKNSTPKPRRKA